MRKTAKIWITQIQDRPQDTLLLSPHCLLLSCFSRPIILGPHSSKCQEVCDRIFFGSTQLVRFLLGKGTQEGTLYSFPVGEHMLLCSPPTPWRDEENAIRRQ